MTINKITLLFLLIFSPPLMAIDRWGEFNETFKYDNLKIQEMRDGSCLIEGTIINTTSELKDGVYVKIYAYSIHDTFYWSKILFFSTIPANDEIDFSESILDCSEDNPYKMKYKVTE